jgi:hypothetical protein
MLPLPPYGKILKSYQDANVKLHYPLTIFTGKEAFNRAKKLISYEVCLCLPFESLPENYHWPVKDLSIIIIDTGSTDLSILECLAICLIQQGEGKIVVIQSDHYSQQTEIYIR